MPRMPKIKIELITSLPSDPVQRKRLKDSVTEVVDLQRQIADLGTARIAEVAGINKSTVSRWRENLVPNMSLLLAILISNRDGVKGDFEA